MHKNTQPEYIIIGAGSAGSALAYRLTEDPRTSVLLLEAGKPTHPLSRIPVSFGLFIDKPGVNWRYRSEPEEGTANRVIPVPRGKMVGGSSAINGLVYVRGQTLDYDTWGQLGNRSWTWERVSKVFQRMENFDGGADEVRGRNGPLGISEVPDENPLYDALISAAQSAGYPHTSDYNGLDQEGVGKTQATIKGGRRMSAARCYLEPASRRPNLEIVTEAMTQHLTLEGKRCTGVVYRKNGKDYTGKCNREVILSAGAVSSPQILELSGIGDPEILKKYGITVRHELRSVGENFRDHIASRINWKVTMPGVSYNEKARGLGLIGQMLQYATTGGGFFSLPSTPVVAFVKTRPEMETPDLQLSFFPYAVENPKKRKLYKFPGMTFICYQLRPESLGSIHIRSNKPDEQPAIRFNFLHDPIDLRAMIDGVNIMRNIVGSSPMDPYRGEEFKPGKEIAGDTAIENWLRDTGETAYHPMGTCRMGSSPNAVVDDKLKVYGLEGLRVADASIFPTMPSGNTNAAAIMVGERASDLIKEG